MSRSLCFRFNSKRVLLYLVIPSIDSISTVYFVIRIRRVIIIDVLTKLVVGSVLHHRSSCKVLSANIFICIYRDQIHLNLLPPILARTLKVFCLALAEALRVSFYRNCELEGSLCGNDFEENELSLISLNHQCLNLTPCYFSAREF